MPSPEIEPARDESVEAMFKRLYLNKKFGKAAIATTKSTELAGEATKPVFEFADLSKMSKEELLQYKEKLLARRQKLVDELERRKRERLGTSGAPESDTPPEAPDGTSVDVPKDDSDDVSDDTPEGTQDDTPKDAPDDAPDDKPEDTAEVVEEEKEKAKKKRAFRTAITSAAAVALAGFIAIGTSNGLFSKLFGFGQKNATPDIDPRASYTETVDDADDIYAAIEKRLGIETRSVVGEYANGVHYDYTEYSDFGNKTSKVAFGYDKSNCFNDADATADAWVDMANKAPEYLGAYAYYAFTDEEKAELGIAGMSSKEIDDYLSNQNNADGGEKQRKIINALDKLAHDKESTSYVYYHENDTEDTYYIVFQDKNEDGNYTPDELSLAYSTVKRNGAPQVDVYRMINGHKVKVLDLNMACGLQPNMEKAPVGLPKVTKHESVAATPEIIQEEVISGGDTEIIDTPQEEIISGGDTEIIDTPQEIISGGDTEIIDTPQEIISGGDTNPYVPPRHIKGSSSRTPSNTPKDTQKEIENAGPRATQLEQDKPVTKAPDSTTYEDIVKQKVEDDKKADAAKEVAKKQSKAETEAVVTAAKRNAENEKKEEQRLSGLSTEERKSEEARQKVNEEKANQALNTASQTTTENSRTQYEKEATSNAAATAAEAAQAAANAAAEAISRQSAEQGGSGGPSASERANMSF